MIKLKYNSGQIILLALLLLSFLCFNSLNHTPSNTVIKTDKPLTLNPNIARIISLGAPKLVSSYLWMLTMLQSDIDHTKEDRSWMFYRFKAISSLDPYFFENYLYGGLYLSIIKNDLRGAEDIYNEGLKFYPSSLDLLWNAGFNLCFELKECPKAIPYFTKLINLDTDMRFKIASSILSKIHIKEENKKLGFMILYTSYQKMPDGQLKERVEKNLYELKKEIDYECFKGNETSCEDFDFFGKRYNFSK